MRKVQNFRALIMARLFNLWLFPKIKGRVKVQFAVDKSFYSLSYSHLFCTLISENPGLEKSNYTINLKKSRRKTEKKIRCTEKEFSCAGPEIFLSFEIDLDFSRP